MAGLQSVCTDTARDNQKTARDESGNRFGSAEVYLVIRPVDTHDLDDLDDQSTHEM